MAKEVVEMTTHLSFRQGVQSVSQHYWVMPVLVFHLVLWLRLQNFSILEYLVMSCYICRCCAIYYVRVVYSRYTDISSVLTVFIVNSRMFLLSMSLAPNFKTYGFWNRVGLGSLVTDETFGVAIHLI